MANGSVRNKTSSSEGVAFRPRLIKLPLIRFVTRFHASCQSLAVISFI